jgi:hypothetical protein
MTLARHPRARHEDRGQAGAAVVAVTSTGKPEMTVERNSP